ncbi:MAG: PEP-CTERM sorting domain-containing protein [Massilia sp.]
MNFMQKALLITAYFCVGAATAAPTPVSYDMLNGNTGSYTYWDDSYTGSGCTTCDNAALTGGTGQLTDGIIATDNWYVTEAPSGPGPYLGWTLDPTITFHWNATTSVNSVTFYLDDSDGAGGVSPPQSITVNGVNYLVADPAGPAPFSFTASGFAFTGTDLVVTLFRSNGWVFLSEVDFADGVNVPEPSSVLLLMIGLGGLAAVGRRAKR